MNSIRIFMLLVLASTGILKGQSLDSEVLFSINGEEVFVKEFLESYNRNLDLIQDPEQKKLDYNLELYKKYRAKLQQAHVLGLDTLSSYKEEIATYRKQLSESYFNDPKEEEKLIQEAYERSKFELNVSHILILVKEDASENEKKAAISKLNSIKEEIESGKINFADAAKKYSQDPSAKSNSGNLNWMTVFYMVYPFESAAYELEVGELSNPVKTQFGYHLLKLNKKRESLGKVQLAHILKYYIPGKDRDSLDIVNKNLLDSISLQVKEGKDFGDLARRYSDDKRSGMNGGNIPPVGVGRLFPEMEKHAFSLEEGELSQPFKSRYGWHLLKLNKKMTIASYEESKDELLKQIRKESRHSKIEKSILGHLKQKYKIVVDEKNMKLFESKLNDENISKTEFINVAKGNSIVLKINEKKVSLDSYIEYYKKHPVQNKAKLSASYLIEKQREDFINSEVLAYYDSNLEKEYPEFELVMRNYKEGILVYNLMNEKIWLQSYRDTVGINNFYQNNKEKYMWPERGNLLVAKCFNEKAANKVKKYLKRDWTKEKIEKKLNKPSDVNVTFQSGIVTKENKVVPEDFKWELGVSDIYKKSDNNYVIINVLNFVEPQIKTFEEAEKRIRSDYQTFLEEQWEIELVEKFGASVNEKVYIQLKEEIE